MADIRAAAKDDPDLDPDTMSPEKKKDLIKALILHCDAKRTGVCVSNLAAAQDIAHTVQSLDQEVQYFIIIIAYFIVAC